MRQKRIHIQAARLYPGMDYIINQISHCIKEDKRIYTNEELDDYLRKSSDPWNESKPCLIYLPDIGRIGIAEHCSFFKMMPADSFIQMLIRKKLLIVKNNET